eukprot:gene25909-11585_t
MSPERATKPDSQLVQHVGEEREIATLGTSEAMHEDETHGPGKEEDGSLDFLSENFDATKALATPGLVPPDPDAVPADNISKCRYWLPTEMEESLTGAIMPKGKVPWSSETSSPVSVEGTVY